MYVSYLVSAICFNSSEQRRQQTKKIISDSPPIDASFRQISEDNDNDLQSSDVIAGKEADEDTDNFGEVSDDHPLQENFHQIGNGSVHYGSSNVSSDTTSGLRVEVDNDPDSGAVGSTSFSSTLALMDEAGNVVSSFFHYLYAHYFGVC